MRAQALHRCGLRLAEGAHRAGLDNLTPMEFALRHNPVAADVLGVRSLGITVDQGDVDAQEGGAGS